MEEKKSRVKKNIPDPKTPETPASRVKKKNVPAPKTPVSRVKKNIPGVK